MTFEELQAKADDFASTGDIKSFEKLNNSLEDFGLDEDDEMQFQEYLRTRKLAVEARLRGSIMEAQQYEYEADMMFGL